MKVLLLVPHRLAEDRHAAVRRGDRPQADYDAVADAIRAMPGGKADILDLTAAERDGGWLVRATRRLLGANWALAMFGFQRRRGYDAVLTHSEIVGIPFAMLIATLWRRPRHVTTAYYLTGRRNEAWYRLLRAHHRMDKIFTLGREQYETGRGPLGISEDKLVHMESCGYVDIGFFAAAPAQPIVERQICSVGREFRDYETLIKAMAGLPDITLKIDPASPWSLHQNRVGGLSIPPNVEICHMELGTVRRLYAESEIVVIPLYPNPIGAGTTTLVEAMAMGKPVIVTRSQDNSFARRQDIVDGDNIVLVRAGDVADLRAAIARLMGDADLRRRIGANGRRWAEQRAGRQQWLGIVLGALAGPVGSKSSRAGQPATMAIGLDNNRRALRR